MIKELDKGVKCYLCRSSMVCFFCFVFFPSCLCNDSNIYFVLVQSIFRFFIQTIA